MDKKHRAQIIAGSIRSMIRGKAPATAKRPAPGEISLAKIDGLWSAAITWGSATQGASPDDIPVEQWDMLHLHADGELKLALRLYDYAVEIIVFKPGQWEQWFTTYQVGDNENLGPSTR